MQTSTTHELSINSSMVKVLIVSATLLVMPLITSLLLEATCTR